jgi:hypothetical protein
MLSNEYAFSKVKVQHCSVSALLAFKDYTGGSNNILATTPMWTLGLLHHILEQMNSVKKHFNLYEMQYKIEKVIYFELNLLEIIRTP